MVHSFVLFALLVTLSHAYTTFNTVCSTPSTAVNYVSSADTRGTLDILWSCLFTIVACTWTVQHLNIPEQREGRDPGWLGNFKWMIKRGWSSTKWMLVTIIAPEFLVSKYWVDLMSARLVLENFKKFAVEDDVPWTLSHCLFANMGGFAIRTHATGHIGKERTVDGQSYPSTITQQDTANNLLDKKEPSTSDAIVPLAGKGLDPQKSPGSTVHGRIYHLTADDILSLRGSGTIARLPYISPEELQDRSKSDSLVRAIAVAQVLWMVIQVLARAARDLAISQLEISVVAFASCAIAIYGLNWYKPKGVQVPITILQYNGEPPSNVQNGLASNTNTAIMLQVDMIYKLLKRPNHDKGTPIPNTHSVAQDYYGYGDYYGFVFGSIVFGGIHLAAWKFDFPTRADQILWWSASVFCTSLVLVFILVIFLVTVSFFAFDMDDDYYIQLASTAVLISYGMARLILLVEIFRTLFFLPPSAYIATWASNIPSIT